MEEKIRPEVLKEFATVGRFGAGIDFICKVDGENRRSCIVRVLCIYLVFTCLADFFGWEGIVLTAGRSCMTRICDKPY